jgi:hypothetical protein
MGEAAVPSFPSPTLPAASRAEVHLRYLDYFRAVLVAKLEGLPVGELRSSRLPSAGRLWSCSSIWLMWRRAGWSGALKGAMSGDPWGDQRAGRWHVPAEQSLAELVGALEAQAAGSRAVVDAHSLDEVGQPGERWDGAAPATLERVLLHLLQEYARHVGHPDVVRELIDGRVGEE